MTVKATVLEAVLAGDAESLIPIVKLYAPPVVGIPERTPELASAIPDGNAPDDTDHR